MLDTSARLLRLLALLQTRRDWSGADLAGRLGVTGRTVRRDVERLRALGYPVEATYGAAGGYHLGRGAVLPPLLLDDEEAVAITLALRSAASAGVSGLDDAALRALVKLDSVLPSRLQHRVRTVGDAVSTLPSRGPQVDVDTLTTVAGAVRDRHRLRLDYVAHDGSRSTRVVEPHRIVHTGTRWYLLAWDRGRDDWRTLRLDRLTPRTPTGPPFTPRPAPDPDPVSYVMRGVTSRVYPYRCDVTVEASAEKVIELWGAHAADVEPLAAGRCRVRAGAADLDEAVGSFVRLGADLTVHEPIELREHVASVARRLARITPAE